MKPLQEHNDTLGVAEHYTGQIIHPQRGDFSYRLVPARFTDFDIVGA